MAEKKKPSKRSPTVDIAKAYISAQAQLEKARTTLIDTARSRFRAARNGLTGQVEALDTRFQAFLADEKQKRAKRVSTWRFFYVAVDRAPVKEPPTLESEIAYRSIQRSYRRGRTWLLMLIRRRWTAQASARTNEPWRPDELEPSRGTKTHFASGMVRPKPLIDEEYATWQARFSQPTGKAMVERQKAQSTAHMGRVSPEQQALEQDIQGYIRSLDMLLEQRKAAQAAWMADISALRESAKKQRSGSQNRKKRAEKNRVA